MVVGGMYLSSSYDYRCTYFLVNIPFVRDRKAVCTFSHNLFGGYMENENLRSLVWGFVLHLVLLFVSARVDVWEEGDRREFPSQKPPDNGRAVTT